MPLHLLSHWPSSTQGECFDFSCLVTSWQQNRSLCIILTIDFCCAMGTWVFIRLFNVLLLLLVVLVIFCWCLCFWFSFIISFFFLILLLLLFFFFGGLYVSCFCYFSFLLLFISFSCVPFSSSHVLFLFVFLCFLLIGVYLVWFFLLLCFFSLFLLFSSCVSFFSPGPHAHLKRKYGNSKYLILFTFRGALRKCPFEKSVLFFLWQMSFIHRTCSCWMFLEYVLRA